MNRFAKVLQEVGSRLDVAEPLRSRILMEIASDLEDSFGHHRAQGADEAEAVRRAEQAFAVSDESLRMLERVHRTGLEGVADRLSGQVGSIWSRILMVSLLGFELLLAFRVLSNRSFFVHPSPFLWPLALLAGAAIFFTAWKLWQLSSPSLGGARRLRTGLEIPLYFAGYSLAVAGLGFLYHLQRFFRLNARTAPESLFANFAGWMISISSLMVVALWTAILAGLVWFVLSRLAARAEAREIEQLLRGAA